MKQMLGQLLIQIRGAWRFRWHALGTGWAAAILGWMTVMLLPNVYEAHARVYVDTESVLKPLLIGLAVNTDVTNRVSMMSRVMMGRPNLERVARETKLARRAHNPAQFVQLINRLSKQITLEGGSGGNVYSLRYSDNDPAMAQRVVQNLLDAFLEDTLGLKRADSGSAEKFLQTQIREYETRLRDAEDRLADFKRRNVGLMPGETGDYYSRLEVEGEKLKELRARFNLATERRNELSKQLEGEQPTFGLFASSEGSGSTAADAQIMEYRHQLEQLLLQYTDKHPRVIALKETIAQLEGQKEASTRKSRAGSPLPRDRSEAAALALDINPVYQSLRIELSHTQVELAELRQQLSQEEGVVGDLKSRVNTIPMIEAQLAGLTRDYEVTKTQQQALLQRLESARLSQQAEASNDQVKFRIIEPATRPLLPIGPNRFLMLSGVLAAALAVGCGLAVALNQLNPVFLSRGMLAIVTGLPVLGSIRFVRQTPRAPLLLRDPVLVGVAGCGLLLTYVLSVGLADSVSGLVQGLVEHGR
jgi:polysaccharide chain length determinant protein (PEP-CTERM system associated)